MTKTIGFVIVDGEILQGNATADPDLNYVLLELASLNYRISKMSVVPAHENLITFETEHLLKQNDFVVLIDRSKCSRVHTALADLFKEDLLANNNLSPSECEMPIPKNSKILAYDNSVKIYPVIYLNRLFIIRDVNLRLVFDNILKAYLKQFSKERWFKKRIYSSSLVEVRSPTGEIDHRVTVRNYNEGGTLVTEVASLNLEELLRFDRSVEDECTNVIGSRAVIEEDVYSLNCFSNVQAALECIEKCLAEYGPENVFISFNGGKDCTVLLHLVLAVLRKRHPDYSGKVMCMYVQSTNPFREVNRFIDQVRRYYNLEIVTITKGVKEGLCTFLKDEPHMKACLMGTRSTDPFSENLEPFQMTDPDWPQVMRVSPLLHWHYSDVWDYLLYFQVPYCRLYDEGYTSLGSVDNTVRNPNLLYGIGREGGSYLPAYKLIDGSKERSGRK